MHKIYICVCAHTHTLTLIFVSSSCFLRLREPVSVMAGKARTLLRPPRGLTSSAVLSTCRIRAGAALTLWVCNNGGYSTF